MLTLIVLGVLGGIAFAGGAMAITLRNPIYAVLSLVVGMLGIAGVYFLLGAEYLGAIQVIVYAGAILVTFLFVVMLVSLAPEDIPPLPRGIPLYLTLLVAGGWMGVLAYALRSVIDLPTPTQAQNTDPDLPYLYGTLPPVSKTLFTAYAFPFELLSVTLLVGLIGASLLVQKRPTHES